MRNKRRRRRNVYNKKTRMNFTAILAIISIAVFLGYGAARFVIYPLLGYEDIIVGHEDVVKNDENSQAKVNEIIEDGLDIQPKTDDAGLIEDKSKTTEKKEPSQVAETQGGYYIQFGSFSSKESAQELVEELKAIGINAEILEKEGVFKVRSNLFENREKAREIKATLANTPYSDAFITQ